MHHTTIKDEQDRIDFVTRAAKRFAREPELKTYTDGDIEPGCLFAVRWGLGNDCVLVFKLDELFTPINYGQVIAELPQDDALG